MKVGRITAMENKSPDRMTAAEYRTVTAKPKGANATEAAFGEHLRMLHRDGIITEPRFEAVKLPLISPCGIKGTGARTYTPDWTFKIPAWDGHDLAYWDNVRQFNADTRAELDPDQWDYFDVLGPASIKIVVDVKGTRQTKKLRKSRAYYREDAFIDIRLAACLWPSWAFFLAYKTRCGWKWERVKGGKLGGEVDW